MKQLRLVKTWIVFAALLVSLSGASLHAATPKSLGLSPTPQTVAVSEEFLTAVDIALVELAGLRKIKKLDDAQIAEFERKVSTLEQIVAKQDEALVKSGAESAELRAALAVAKDVIAAYKGELERVRADRDKAKKRVVKVGTAALVAGILLGLFLGK